MAKKAPKKPTTLAQKKKDLAEYIDTVIARAPGSGAPMGNKNWMHRLKDGRYKIYEYAEDLALECLKYLVWCEENPLIEGKGKDTSVPKMRAPLIKQMCNHIGISYSTWKNYKKQQDDIGTVARMISDEIHSIKLQGAYAGLLEAVIAHRDLNLVERFDLSSEDGTMSPPQPDELDLSKLTLKELDNLASLAKKLGSDSQKPV